MRGASHSCTDLLVQDTSAFMTHCYEVYVSLVSSVAADWNMCSKVGSGAPGSGLVLCVAFIQLSLFVTIPRFPLQLSGTSATRRGALRLQAERNTVVLLDLGRYVTMRVSSSDRSTRALTRAVSCRFQQTTAPGAQWLGACD